MRSKAKPYPEILKRERKLRGLSQLALSKESSISLPMLQLIEAGKTNPSLETVRKLNQSLGLELSITPRFSPLEQFLAHLGLIQSEASTLTLKLNSEKLTLWIKEIQQDQGKENPRFEEAWTGFKLSMFEYFPSFAKRMRIDPIKTSITGKVIKLKRIALPQLIEILKS